MARDVLRGEKRDGRLIRLTERDSRSEEEAEKDCRLRRESDERRDIVADECNEDTAGIFLRRTPMELELVSAARTAPIPCRGKDSARADISRSRVT